MQGLREGWAVLHPQEPGLEISAVAEALTKPNNHVPSHSSYLQLTEGKQLREGSKDVAGSELGWVRALDLFQLPPCRS